jgi:hypothetical protein
MDTKLKVSILLIFALFITLNSCKKEDNNSKKNDTKTTDDSPGVDEYLVVIVNGIEWRVDEDEKLIATVASFSANNTTLSFAATNIADTTYLQFVLDYFYGNDTLYDFNESGASALLQITSNSLNDSTGAMNVTRSIQNGMEVYEGTFNLIGSNSIYPSYPNDTFSNGQFRIARLL